MSNGAGQLNYEIRGIVSFAQKVESYGVKIYWENVGDPVNKGEKIPLWIKNIITEVLKDDTTWAYSPTKGVYNTRHILSSISNRKYFTKLSPEDILFFNGLGDAISKVYSLLNTNARVIGPSPAYPTHSSAEGAHSGYEHLTYNLNPRKNWQIDIDDLRNKVKYNDTIVGILIINPDNPTGMVYPKEVLQEVVNIAREFNLFIISDEIYSKLVYNNAKMVSIAELIGEVPAIIMRGISKELPWPGARCGWVEFHNKKEDKNFAKYAESLVNSKMLEVCSTTLPQAVLPYILEDERYNDYIQFRCGEIEKRANYVYNLLRDVDGIIVNRTYGAFYTTIVFNEKYLNRNLSLVICDKHLEGYVKSCLNDNDCIDKRFVYFLLASSGICVVPLTSFCCSLNGFRITLLEKDWDEFVKIFNILKQKIIEFLNS